MHQSDDGYFCDTFFHDAEKLKIKFDKLNGLEAFGIKAVVLLHLMKLL
jgi:hypothetical protein